MKTSQACGINITPSIPQLRHAITTAQAAVVLNRKPQTLRKWACLENGPIRPIRINGRLAWPVTELQALLHGVTL